MLEVLFTVDVEVWCDGWRNLDGDFPDAFRRYVYGPTPKGDYGLPFKLKLFQDHGLTGTWFVEPLFSLRFGLEPLAEIVDLVQRHGQEVQLHLHPEWLDEVSDGPARHTRKEAQMAAFTLDEQTRIIAAGLQRLRAAGAGDINAFRAGNYGFNLDTLRALAANGLQFDSSYNGAMGGAGSGLHPQQLLTDPLMAEGMCEYPVTVFRDGTAHLRPVQLTAISWREMEGLLWQSLEQQRPAFVIVSHNFELLDPSKRRADPIAVRRYRQLCEFLGKHTDSFRVTGFSGLLPQSPSGQAVVPSAAPLQSPLWRTGLRYVEQALRRAMV